MKNVMIKMFSVTLIVLVTLVNVNAANNFLAIKLIGDRSFQISVDNVVGQAQLKIVDLQGTTIYKSDVNHDGAYSRNLNVSKLPLGTYLLVIEDEFKTKTVDLNIYKEVSLDLDQVKTQFNPIIMIAEDKVTISMHAFTKEKMTISFYDETRGLIDMHTLKGKGYLAKKFSLELLDAGTYKVLINHRGRTFSKELSI